MSAPLSLRVCCLVAMAPALTDPVATQTKLKIKVLDPSLSLPIGNPVEVVHKDSISIHKGEPNCKVTLNSVLNLKQIENSILKTVGLNSKIKQIKIIQKGANRKDTGQLGVVHNNEHSGDQKMNQPLESVNGMPKENGLKTANELKKSIELNTLTNLNGDHDTVNHTLQNGDQEQAYTVNSVPDMVTSVNSGTEVARDDVCDGADIDTEFVDIENEETDPIKSEKELSEEVSEKQHVLERRADRLLKRLRRLQGRQLETHIRNQTGSYVSFLHRNLQSVAHRSMGISGPNSELKAELLKSEDVKSLSTAALVNLVRKIQSTQNQAALNKRIATQKKAKEEKPSQSVLVIDGQICKEANRVSGQLQTNLNHMLDTLDSDATESSSGGESCDEDDEYERERKIPPPPLHRRAEWKWASDRAAVACRWTWLQAQVSDLEYRIRQQSDIHKQIRHNKGSVVLGEPPSLEELGARLRQARANGKLLSPIETKIADFDAKNVSGSPCNIAAVMTNVNRQATKLTQSLGNCLTPIQSNLLTENKLKDGQCNSLNGVVNSTHPSSTTEENLSSVLPGPSGDASSVEQSPPSALLDATCQAARCRPVRSYRKRKLLRTSGLHQVSRKAARLSTVKCHCSPPFSSCPMCGGRYNNSQTVDADTMPVNERVSLLDPSYHPVLSFNEEIPLTIHFEALLKSGDWQNKPPPKATKLLSTDRKRQKLLVPSVRGKVRKQTKYAKGAATALLASAKLRNKYERRTPTKGRPSLKSTRKVSDLRKRRMTESLSIALKQDSMDDGQLSGPSDYDDEDEYANCGRDTLLSSSGASTGFRELKDATMRKRRLESAYDIDNIVIPYSIASATRVVKLEYKEIVTPKWRDITENSEETDNTPEDTNKELTDETENTSDEFFAAMHDKCEIQERKRFQSFIKYPSRRSRGSRNDSGPLTPDTASTDVCVLNEGNDSAQRIDDDTRRRSQTLSSSGGSHTNLAASLREEVFRRRSSSASLRRSSVSVGTDDISMDIDDGELVEPWPIRSFPLSEEEYEEMKTSVSQPEVETCTYFTRNKISSNSIVGLDEETSVSEGTTFDAVETQVSVPESPNSSAGSHTSEDPNDPEWTVANSDKLGEKNLVRLGRR
ncbi:KAT8 regulatory NSL complex subunit 1-like [Saccostrea echinata]|uniref:KAT8 regulatory NSL complex subunit 1-like n=1 Tax=Saccostrea echinata TaxID=191078 RepID=UPI002A7EA8E1|nr:KAT8 regulatory NSL complex subunit 1-like [Saccostrea echinata]